MWKKIKESLKEIVKNKKDRKELLIYIHTELQDENSLLFNMLCVEGYAAALPVLEYYYQYCSQIIVLVDDLNKNGTHTCEDLKPRLKEYEQIVKARIKKNNELKDQERREWLTGIESTIASVVSNMDIVTEIKELKEQVAKLVLLGKK